MSALGDTYEDSDGLTWVCVKVDENGKLSYWAPKDYTEDEE